MSSKKSVKEVEEQLARLRTQTIMASNGLMVGDNQTVGRISNINKQKANMSYEFNFDDDMDGRKADLWSKILDKISPKAHKDPVLKITMTKGLERRIRGAMFMGDIDSVALFCKMAFTLLEKAIDAKASGGRMVILEKDGTIREVKI